MRAYIIVVFMLIAIILVAMSCNDDCPTCPLPQDEEEIISDYNVILAGNDNPFLIYNTKSRTIIDTVHMPFITEYRSMAVNGDGRHLLLSNGNWDWGGMMVVDLETYDTIKTFPNWGWINVSNTGKYILFTTEDGPYILDGSNYDIIDTLENASGLGSFTFDDSKYCYLSPGPCINIYDMESRLLDTSFIYVDNDGLSPSLQSIQVDHSCRKFYFIATYSSSAFFLASYSMDLDSTTLSYRVAHPFDGHLHITPDGRQIIYTDPGWLMIDEIGTCNIIFVEVASDAVTAILDGYLSAGIEYSMSDFIAGHFAITPDSRYTIVSPAGLGYDAFGMIDNNAHRFVDVQPDTMPFPIWNFTVSCQKLLK